MMDRCRICGVQGLTWSGLCPQHYDQMYGTIHSPGATVGDSHAALIAEIARLREQLRAARHDGELSGLRQVRALAEHEALIRPHDVLGREACYAVVAAIDRLIEGKEGGQ